MTTPCPTCTALTTKRDSLSSTIHQLDQDLASQNATHRDALARHGDIIATLGPGISDDPAYRGMIRDLTDRTNKAATAILGLTDRINAITIDYHMTRGALDHHRHDHHQQ